MIRMAFSVQLDYRIAEPGADFILNIQAAHTRQQWVISESLQLSRSVTMRSFTDLATQTRYLRLNAGPGDLTVSYQAEVDLQHHTAAVQQVPEVPVRELPDVVLPYLYPSRYCESDHLAPLAMQLFGQHRRGCERVLAIRDWVNRRLVFRSQSSIATTSARDSLASGAGVCRDFAHVMIAMCRALSIPARFATGFDYGADPELGPPDFHAYVEAYLGRRWYLFDPSGTAIPMSFVRLATGRDASDAAFATLFGPVTGTPPRVHVTARPDAQGRLNLPWVTTDALSTDDGQP